LSSPVRPELRRLGCLAAVGALAALSAVASAVSASTARVVEYTVALDATQTTSWTAHGSYAWCSDSTQRLPFDGSGQATVHVTLPAGAQVGLVPGSAPSFGATVPGTVDRSGSLVEHDGSVTSRPGSCDPLAGGDAPADTSRCGQSNVTVSVAVGSFGGTSPSLRSRPGRTLPLGCAWLSDIHGDGGGDTPSGILAHAETYDALAQVALPGLRIPGPNSFAPSSSVGKATQSWNVAIPGGSLDVTTTTQVTARVALLPLIQPGRSIAGIRLGETYAELRRASAHSGGMSVPDSGDRTNSDHRWEWSLGVGVPYRDAAGDFLQENVWVSSPAGGARSISRPGPPPANARVTRIETVSTLETTTAGVGEKSLLADVRRAEPHGHLLVFGGPIAWLVDGPGRRRTAFMLYRGVVQSVDIGCRQTNPVERGAPVDDAALC
jgi:hypothetical protein